MTLEERELRLLGPSGAKRAILRFEVGVKCRVEVVLPEELISGDGPDLFDALATVRQKLELRNIILSCNGARRDVYPSPMLRQAAAGRRAYVLTLPKTQERPLAVDIFDAPPDDSLLATVEEQRAAFAEWVNAGPGTDVTAS